MARVDFRQPVLDCDVGADDEHRVGKARVVSSCDLVQDAPRRKHRHDGRFTGAGRHLAAKPLENGEALSLTPVARFIERDGNALQIIGAGFVEKNDRFRRFELSEK